MRPPHTHVLHNGRFQRVIKRHVVRHVGGRGPVLVAEHFLPDGVSLTGDEMVEAFEADFVAFTTHAETVPQRGAKAEARITHRAIGSICRDHAQFAAHVLWRTVHPNLRFLTAEDHEQVRKAARAQVAPAYGITPSRSAQRTAFQGVN